MVRESRGGLVEQGQGGATRGRKAEGQEEDANRAKDGRSKQAFKDNQWLPLTLQCVKPQPEAQRKSIEALWFSNFWVGP